MHNPRSMCPKHFELSELTSDGTTFPAWLGMLRGQGVVNFALPLGLWSGTQF